jgi:hypothetical protein
MRQRPKSLKPKAKLPVAPELPKNESAKVRDLETRLAEALEREAEALKRESEALDPGHRPAVAAAPLLRVLDQAFRPADRGSTVYQRRDQDPGHTYGRR